MPLQSIPGRSFLSKAFCSGKVTKNDPFIRLPPEIRMMIIDLLPIASIGKVRKASSAFASVELGEKFFKQYLELGGHYGFLHFDPIFHDNFKQGNIVSYASMFPSCRGLDGWPAASHYRRVWGASLELLRLVATRMDAEICLGYEWFKPRASNLPKFIFPQAETIGIFQGPERLLHSRWIQTTKRLREIRISTMKIKDRTYISGFCFVQQDKEEHCLGFVHPASAQTAWSSSNMVGNRGNPSQVRLAIDRMGIRGIRFWGRAYPSSWIGDCDSKAMMMQRVKLRYNMAKDGSKARVFFVEARFDNLKLMDFA